VYERDSTAATTRLAVGESLQLVYSLPEAGTVPLRIERG
jgi:hypothetical protein